MSHLHAFYLQNSVKAWNDSKRLARLFDINIAFEFHSLYALKSKNIELIASLEHIVRTR